MLSKAAIALDAVIIAPHANDEPRKALIDAAAARTRVASNGADRATVLTIEIYASFVLSNPVTAITAIEHTALLTAARLSILTAVVMPVLKRRHAVRAVAFETTHAVH